METSVIFKDIQLYSYQCICIVHLQGTRTLFNLGAKLESNHIKITVIPLYVDVMSTCSLSCGFVIGIMKCATIV